MNLPVYDFTFSEFNFFFVSFRFINVFLDTERQRRFTKNDCQKGDKRKRGRYEETKKGREEDRKKERKGESEGKNRNEKD